MANRIFQRRWLCGGLLAVAVFYSDLISTARAQSSNLVGTQADQQAEARVYAALAKPVTLHSSSQPLGKIMTDIGRQIGVPTAVDWGILQKINIGPENQVTLDVEDVSARLALKLLLRSLDPTLAWTVDDGTLLITTRDMSYESLRTHIYWIGDLIDEQNEDQNYDKLIDLMQTTIEPHTWDIEGGNGQLRVMRQAKAVFCTQSFEVQQRIQSLLAILRESPDPAQGVSDIVIVRSDEPQEDQEFREFLSKVAERRGREPKIDANPEPWRVPQLYDE
ncbi:MAG: hypothetical protein K8T91_27585 [Planctomycetes bacterium]|nr:hypothetical protein [Planctomycetota bacterium]